MAARQVKYALELTRNSKTGWAFSLSRRHSCIGSTKLCRRLCYVNGIRYASEGQREKRLRNFKTCELLLAEGGPQLLAQNLVALVEQARPADWFASKVAGRSSGLPFVLRLHDSGDMFSVDYAQSWLIAVKKRPECRFWFYSRSFLDGELLEALSELASQPNCQGFLSLDGENYKQGLQAYARYPGVWKLALLQQHRSELPAGLMPALRQQASHGQIISFPYHRGGYHVEPIRSRLLTHCPQITADAYPLRRGHLEPKPCQVCRLCLPV